MFLSSLERHAPCFLERVPRSTPPTRRPRLSPREQLELLWELRREVEGAPTSEPRDVLPKVGRLLVQSFAEYCAVELVDDRRKLVLHSVLHADPKRTHALAAMVTSNEGGAFEKRLGVESRLVMPATVEGVLAGVLTLLNTSAARPFDRDDSRFGREFGALLSLLLTRPAETTRMSTSSGVVFKGDARMDPKRIIGRRGRGR